MLVFLLQELSDVDLSDEQELCDSLVEDLQVSFLWTVTDHHLPASVEADTAGALFSEMTVHFCEQHALCFLFWLVSTLVWFHSECTLHGPACDKALTHQPQFNKEAWMDEAHISASLWALKDVSVTKKRETKSSSTPIYSHRGWKFDCGGSMREKFEAKAS